MRRPDRRRQIRVDVPLAGAAHAGLHVLGIADLDVNRVRKLAERLGWPEERTEAKSLADALRSGGTFLTEDADVLIAGDGVDVIVEALPPPLRVWTNRGASTARWIDAELSATP